jgi:fatty acid desaturase
MSPSRLFFRYSVADALLVLGGVGIVALHFWTFLAFDQLPWWVLVLTFWAATWSYCWNLQCISHNFIHNPYFNNPWLNRAFSVLESLAIGVPHLLYHHYHMNHHWGDNDKVIVQHWGSCFGPNNPASHRYSVTERTGSASTVLLLISCLTSA